MLDEFVDVSPFVQVRKSDVECCIAVPFIESAFPHNGEYLYRSVDKTSEDVVRQVESAVDHRRSSERQSVRPCYSLIGRDSNKHVQHSEDKTGASMTVSLLDLFSSIDSELKSIFRTLESHGFPYRWFLLDCKREVSRFD